MTGVLYSSIPAARSGDPSRLPTTAVLSSTFTFPRCSLSVCKNIRGSLVLAREQRTRRARHGPFGWLFQFHRNIRPLCAAADMYSQRGDILRAGGCSELQHPVTSACACVRAGAYPCSGTADVSAIHIHGTAPVKARCAGMKTFMHTLPLFISCYSGSAVAQRSRGVPFHRKRAVLRRRL